MLLKGNLIQKSEFLCLDNLHVGSFFMSFKVHSELL